LNKNILFVLLAWGASEITIAQTVQSKAKSAKNPTVLVGRANSVVSIVKPVLKKPIKSAKKGYKRPSLISTIPPKLPDSTIFKARKLAIEGIANAKTLFSQQKYEEALALFIKFQTPELMNEETFFQMGECFRKSSKANKYQEAITIYQKAKTLSTSMLAIGQLYELGGFGIERDVIKAQSYFMKASFLGNNNANFELGRLYFQVLPDSLRNENKGVELLEIAGSNGNRDAQWMLGTIYSKGNSTIAKDMAKAKVWFKKYQENIDKNSENHKNKY
jgi:TPR repeat protein